MNETEKRKQSIYMSNLIISPRLHIKVKIYIYLHLFTFKSW